MAEPKIRFPKFVDDWEQYKIGEAGSFYYGRSCPKWSVTENATIPCVRYGELYTKFGSKIDKVYSYTNIQADKLRFSKGTEVLIPRVGEDPMDYNHCTWLSIPNVAIGEMISVYNTKQNPLFTAMMFNATLRNEFAVRVEGFSVTNLYFEELKNITVYYPCLEEQQKIADFLSTIDEVIAQSEAEVRNLEQQKKAAMQKIFSQEVRFKRENGTSYPEWEEKEISELGNVVTGNTPPTKDKDNYGGDFLWVTPTDISDFPVIYDTERKLTEKGKSKSRILPKEAVLVTCIASIGKNCILSQEGSCNQQINAIIPFSSTNSFYILNVINHMKHELEILGGNGGMKIVTKSIFEHFSVPVPCFEEQQKIADFLSAYDEAISYAKQELDKWKELKKGLLQQMFV